jgi:dihydroorotate dehydrogenase (fumarate)
MNLSTDYLGLKLRTPLVPSASPLSERLDNIKRMEDAGAAAVVLHSLFEEPIRKSGTPFNMTQLKAAPIPPQP